MSTRIAALVAVLFALPAADPPPHPTGWKSVEAPIGMLGHRIGTYHSIAGVRDESGKVGDRSLLVDTIDGFRLEQPIDLWIENLPLPKGERCEIHGYETGRWIGMPDEVAKAAGVPLQQAVWQFHFAFIATSVEQPKGLELK